jgi:6-phosphogluconolactonase
MQAGVNDMYAYVGSRTTRERNARGKGISVLRLDEAQRDFELVQTVSGLVNPSFLAMNAAGTVLYTVHGDQHEISSLAVDAHSGELRFIQSQDCKGRNPVHIALDPTGHFALVSNHYSGTVAVLPLRPDGCIEPVSQLVAMPGTPGPHRVEQPFAKPHFNPFDPSGRYVLVPDKGLDRIFSFIFADGLLRPAPEPFVSTRETSGPRHVAFHPTRPFLYAVNELDSTVAAYRFDVQTGGLRPFQIVSALPDSFTGNSRASEIEVDAVGSTIYASNRGSDTIATFRIDADSGCITFVEGVPANGKTPRYFTLTPNGRTLFCLNEDSDTIVGFDVEASSGRLYPSGVVHAVESPVCMVFSMSA